MNRLHLQPNDDIHDAIDLLEENGIPTCVIGARLYVCLAHQLRDAQGLLEEPDYVVREPVDVRAFREATCRTP